MLLLLSLAAHLLVLLSHGHISPETEIYALKALYDSTDGPNWAWINETEGNIWNFTGNISLINPCDWQGIDCTCTASRDHYSSYYYFFYEFYYDDDDSALTASCNIRKIYLDSYDLDGAIPDEFCYNLPYLTHLHLGNNYLYSTIPTSISSLTSLELLFLEKNYLEGPLDSVSYLANLEILSLYDNMLDGNTSAMERMTSLLYLDIGHNYLDEGDSGNIVTKFSTTLQTLWLNDNFFSGVLDYFVPRLTSLTLFSVHRNFLHGSIDSVAHLSQVKVINVYRNTFTGDVSAVSNLHHLQIFRLYYCNFTGSLEPLSQLYNMITFDAEGNLLTGSIEPLRNLTKLGKLHLSKNDLSAQSLEPLANLTKLSNVGLWNTNGNGFTGSVDILRNLLDIQYFDCDFNQLTGDISALGDLVYATNLYFNNNLLSGTLDALATLTLLQSLDVHGNLLYGTVEVLDHIYTLQYLKLSSNNFHGTLPSALSLNEELTYLSIEDNHFEGTIPSLQSSRYLTGLFVASNLLSGPLDFISPSHSNAFQLLSVIDIHDNMFTGNIPNEWFRMESITNLIASLNCLQLSFTSDICGASKLQALLLDGIHSNAACRYTFSIKVVDEIYYSPEVMSNIPACIYELPSITTLHMSGNGIKTRLPTNVRLNSSLTELVMSYNMISGPIPSAFQRHHFDTLDLANNKITGLLSDDLSISNEFSVQTNRLSGRIPHSLFDTSNVYMLSGNIYSCNRVEVSKLHDNFVGVNYTCGSDTFTYVGIVCFVFIAIILSVVVLSYIRPETAPVTQLHLLITLLRNKRIQLTKECNISEELDSGSIEISICKDIHYFMNISDDIKKFCAILTAIIVLVHLPIYCGLSAYYGKYTNAYAWTASAAYLSGVAPGAILFIFFLLLVLIPGALYSDQMVSVIVNSSKSMVETVFKDTAMTKRHVTERETSVNLAENKVDSDRFAISTSHQGPLGVFTSDSTRHIHSGNQSHAEESSTKRLSKSPEIKRKQLIALAAITLINFIAVGFINGLYVYISFNISGIAETLIELLMGAFKSVWTGTVLLRLIDYAGNHGYLPNVGTDKSRHLNFLTVMVILNNILLPCMALSVVSTDCFYNRIFGLSEVSSAYNFEVCRVYDDYSDGSFSCDYHYKEIGYIKIAYRPPYAYKYQCSSVLVVSYIPVFIYSAIFTGFIYPLIDIGSTRFFIYADKYPNTFTTALANGLKRLQLFAQYIFDTELGEDVFNQTSFILTMNSSISILATFGVIFPFLGFISFLSIVAVLLYQQYRIGKYVHNLYKNDKAVFAGISRMKIIKPGVNLETVYEDKYADELDPTHPDVVEFRINKVKQLNGCFSSVENRLVKSIWNLLPYISIFYSFFILDTVGDEVGATNALWGPILLIVSINIIYAYPFVVHFYKYRIESKRNRQGSSSDAVAPEVQMGAIYKEEDASHRGDFDSGSSTFPGTHNPLYQQ